MMMTMMMMTTMITLIIIVLIMYCMSKVRIKNFCASGRVGH